jgi:hypothetical protein
VFDGRPQTVSMSGLQEELMELICMSLILWCFTGFLRNLTLTQYHLSMMTHYKLQYEMALLDAIRESLIDSPPPRPTGRSKLRVIK